MRKPAKRSFQPAEVHGHIRERLPGKHSVDGYGAVGALAPDPAGGVGIIMPPFFRCRIMGDHRIEVACVYQHRIARPAHLQEIVFVAEIGL